MNGLIWVALRSTIETFKRWRDSLRRKLGRLFFDRTPNQAGYFSQTVVFVRWDAKLGDTVVLSWVLREIRRYRPDLKLSVITGPEYLDLYRQAYRVDHVCLAPKRAGWLTLARIAKQLQRPRYVVHLAERMKARDLFFLWLLGAAQVVGLDDELDRVNVKLGQRSKGLHFSEKLCPWLAAIGVATEHRQYWIPERPSSGGLGTGEARALRPLVGFCPYGASRQRRFSDAALLDLVKALLEQGAHQVILFVTRMQQDSLRALLQAGTVSSQVIMRPTTDLFELFSQINACDAVVSVDTGIVHVAVGLDKPLLAFYNPDRTDDNFSRWHPNSPSAITLFAESCNPQRIDRFKCDDLTDAIGRLMRLIEAKAP